MAYSDLRAWLEYLDALGELLVIEVPVDPHMELGAICRWFLDHRHDRALLFKKVKGSDMPVFANGFATRRRLKPALGL